MSGHQGCHQHRLPSPSGPASLSLSSLFSLPQQLSSFICISLALLQFRHGMQGNRAVCTGCTAASTRHHAGSSSHRCTTRRRSWRFSGPKKERRVNQKPLQTTSRNCRFCSEPVQVRPAVACARVPSRRSEGAWGGWSWSSGTGRDASDGGFCPPSSCFR